MIQRIFSDYASGVPLRVIARRLETEAIPTPFTYWASVGSKLPKGRTFSSKWARATVHRILRNPAYVGKPAAYKYANTEREEIDEYTGAARFTRQTTLRAPDDAAYVALSSDVCPAIIDESTWSAAQARLATNRAEASRHNPDIERSLLRAGYIVCGYCGKNLYFGQQGVGNVNYYCRRTREGGVCAGGDYGISVSNIDNDAWFFVKYLLSHPQMIRDAIERLKSARETADTRAEERLAAFDGIRKKLEEDAANLTQSIRETSVPMSRAILQKELDKVALQLADVLEQQSELARDAVSRLAASDQLAELEELTASMAARADRLTYTQKRALLYALGLTVKVWRTDHTPRYVIKCDFEGLRTGMDISLFEVDDSQLQALRQTANSSPVYCVTENT